MWDESITADNIRSEFRKCGIYPANRNVYPRGAFIPSLLVSYDNQLAEKQRMLNAPRTPASTPQHLATPYPQCTSPTGPLARTPVDRQSSASTSQQQGNADSQQPDISTNPELRYEYESKERARRSLSFETRTLNEMPPQTQSLLKSASENLSNISCDFDVSTTQPDSRPVTLASTPKSTNNAALALTETASRSFTSLETLLCETFLQKHPEAGGVQESTCQKSKRYPHNAEVLTKDKALERMEKFQEAKAKRGKKRSTETNPREVKRRAKKRDVSKKKPASPSPAPSSSNSDNEQPQYADSSELSLNDEQQDSNIYAHFNERSYQNLSKNVKPEHYYAIAYGNLVYIGKTLKKEGIMWETKFLNRGVDYHFDCPKTEQIELVHPSQFICGPLNITVSHHLE